LCWINFDHDLSAIGSANRIGGLLFMVMQTVSPSSLEPSLPLPVANYQILRRLGEGGFAQVYEAWDVRLQRAVALKRLKPTHAKLRAEHLLTEGQLAASLSHPAFVQVYAIDDDGDTQSIVMELVRGQTLREFAGSTPQTEALALDIVRQVAEAMDEAHQANLAHGDLKASNLMVEPSGRIRILDFGLARRLDPLATQTVAAGGGEGTISYMAPERLQGRGPTPSADIYALGVILYELLAGKLPFSELNGFALAAAHLQSTPARWPLPAGVSAETTALLQSMVERDARKRCGSMRGVCEAMGNVGRSWITVPPALGKKGITSWILPAKVLASGIIALLVALCLSGDVQQSIMPDPVPMSDVAALQAGLQALQHPGHDGSLERATAYFNGIVAHNPRHAAANAGLSLAYSLRHTTDSYDESWLRRADAAAQQSLLLDDQLSLSYAALAVVRELQGMQDDALKLNERSLALDPNNPFALGSKANIYLQQHRYIEAESAIKTAIQIYPNERRFTDLLGELRFQQSDAVAAEQAFRRSIALDPASTVSYANLNAALLYQHRDDEALHVLQQGLQIKPDSRLYGNLGAALFARGDMASAARAFEQAISATKGKPNYYLDWANLADALRWLPGREADSRDAYRHAIELLQSFLQHEPKSATLHSRLALYAAKIGEKHIARDALAIAMTGTSLTADLHFRAGITWELLGERQQAIDEILHSKSLGYPINLIESEPDLVSLRRDLRYHQSRKGST
jgi:serine/threonine protein kinase/Flp pilus assembly protein TadD